MLLLFFVQLNERIPVYSNKRRFVSYSSGWKSLSQRLVYQLGRSKDLVLE